MPKQIFRFFVASILFLSFSTSSSLAKPPSIAETLQVIYDALILGNLKFEDKELVTEGEQTIRLTSLENDQTHFYVNGTFVRSLAKLTSNLHGSLFAQKFSRRGSVYAVHPPHSVFPIFLKAQEEAQSPAKSLILILKNGTLSLRDHDTQRVIFNEDAPSRYHTETSLQLIRHLLFAQRIETSAGKSLLKKDPMQWEFLLDSYGFLHVLVNEKEIPLRDLQIDGKSIHQLNLNPFQNLESNRLRAVRALWLAAPNSITSNTTPLDSNAFRRVKFILEKPTNTEASSSQISLHLEFPGISTPLDWVQIGNYQYNLGGTKTLSSIPTCADHAQNSEI